MTSSVLRLVVGDDGREPTITDDSTGPGIQPDVVRYRLDVIAFDVADLVASVGGWLYDRAARGWQVTVAAPADHDDRPLRILGAQTVALEQALAEPVRAEPGSALAVGAEALIADTRVQRRVVAMLENARGEVTVWGTRRPSIVEHRVRTTDYTPTGAAWVFKNQALAAVGATEVAAGAIEVVHTGSNYSA